MVDTNFLVTTILVIIALLFYTLYWSRSIAFLIGLLFRVVFWNRGGSSVWIHIGSFHISILAGRILFKDFHYHSSNQTFKIVKVELRWQYWVRSLARFDDLQAQGGGEEPKSGNVSQFPHCRFHATLEGFEWFIYNRTAAFDHIVSQMEAKTPVPERRTQSFSVDGPASQWRQIFTRPSPSENDVQTPHVRSPFSTPTFLRTFVRWLRGQLPGLDFKDLLPFSFVGLNGGIVCGNMANPNILVAEFSRADGIFGTVPSKSPLDLYKQLLNIKFQNATISLKENDQYMAPMADIGSHIHGHLRKAPSLSYHYFHYLTYSVFSKLYRSARLSEALRAAAKVFKKVPISTPVKTFRPRSRRVQSVDVEFPVGPDSAKREYAIERRLLEAPVLDLSYHVDVVGVVPVEPRSIGSEEHDVGNGDTSPEWGLDLVLHGGLLRYGPWADRQRAELQRVLFPPTYQEADRTQRLKPGDNRIWTAMRIFVEFRGGTTLHIPFREASKNWQWDGHANVPRPRTREAAFLSIKTGGDSTIRYVMPMVADAQGYRSHLDVHLNNVTVSSSLNDTRLLTADSCEISGEMPSPLKWDASRQWKFNISLSQPIFYLLRDHINMFTDLGKDWTSGPPSNYVTWVPMRYIVNLDLHNYEINTYVNDHNVIDRPLPHEENALLTFRGASLHNENIIQSDKFRPAWTSFPFSIRAPDITLSLTLPKWSTHRLQTVEPITKLMTMGLLHLDGSYLYHTDVREENVDQLRLKFKVNDMIFKCLAWSIRHFMIFQQNYFGNFTHFLTLQEYLQKRGQGEIGDPIYLKHRHGMSNQMQVELQLSMDHSLIVLPVGLPGYEIYCPLPYQSPEDVHLGGCIVLSAPEIEVQLRSHNLGLEMNLNIGTIYGDVESDYTERSIFTRSQWIPSSEAFLIEGIDILADRLFGPQPLAAAYVCFWEINVGSVTGMFSASHARTLQSALDAFVTNYKDPMNAPAAEFSLPIPPDVTFLKISFASVRLTWSAAPASVYCYLPQGFYIASNDLAGNNYRKVTSLSVPKVILRFLHSLGNKNDWVEAGEIVFDAALDNYSSPSGWQESALAQAKFLEEQDEPTGRLRKLKVGLRSRVHWMPSRSVYAPVLRLPRPHVSSSSTAYRASRVEDTPPETDLRRPRPFFQRPVYSDSDEEGPYAVMDRDAHLVNSRPPSMLPAARADEESFSEGDESDDVDLTDGSGYDSDGSEWNQGASATFEHTLASYYSRVSRRYSLPIGRPSLWVGNPVVTLRDRRPLSTPAVRPEVMPTEDERCPHKGWKAEITGNRSNTSTTRARSHSIEIWATPLLPSVIIQLLEDDSRAERCLEQRLDALTTSHIRNLLKEKDPINDTIFDVQLSSICAQVVQLVPKPHDHHDGFLHAHVTHDRREDNVGVLDLQVFDLGLKAQAHKEKEHPRQSFSIFAGHIGLSLDVCNSYGPTNRQGVYTVMKASLSEVTSALVHKCANLAWRSLSIRLETDAADHISEVVSAHTGPITHAIDTYRRLQSRILSGARFRIYRTLQWSEKLSVVDLLSTIQPSYLIQTGRPHEIRVHAATKIILYIRNCLSFLAAEEREAIMHHPEAQDTEVTREEVIALIEGQLARLAVDADATSLANLEPMNRIFGVPDSSKVTRPHERVVEAARIKLQTTKVAVLHPRQGTPSEVTLETVDITAAFKKAELLVTSSKSPKDAATAREKHRSLVQHVAVSVALDSVEVLVLPHILSFAQSLVRLRKRSRHTASNLPSIPPPNLAQGTSKTTFLIDATLSLQSTRFQVAAEKLIVALIVSRLGIVSSVYARPHPSSQPLPDLSANSSLFFDSMALQAHSSADKGSLVLQDMLAELLFTKSGLNCALRREVALNPTIRAALAIGRLQLSVPRSAIRLSRFIEEWKADYLPGLEHTIQALVSDLRQGDAGSSSPTSTKQSLPTVNLQFSIGSCGIYLHVLPGTWLSWELMDTVAYLKLGGGVVPSRQLSCPFGVRFSSQHISIASPSKEDRLEDTLGKGGLKVDLPSMTVTGTYQNHGVHVLVSAGFFSITVKPSYWDTLLSVQQKFGNDINDLLHVLADARSRTTPSRGPAKSQPLSSQPFLHSGAFKAKGFRIGLEGHSSTLFFECQDVSGGLTDGEGTSKGKSWRLNVIGLALSLAPKSYAATKSEPGRFDGNRRSAFVKIDCKSEVNHRTSQKSLRIRVLKIHAIMQPSSIGEIGDFIDHLQAEVLNRKDERIRELAAFKEKTQSILQTFEVTDRESTPREAMMWFEDYAVVLNVSNVGVAFPLALDSNIDLHLGKLHQTNAMSAFLFSVRSVEFEDKNKGDSQFVMKGFSFQFVDRFRQSVPSDFAGDGHQTLNRLVYPDMTAQVRTERSTNSRQVRVGANISGFILDLEPSIADHVASLIDVYRSGKERVDRIAVNVPRNTSLHDLGPHPWRVVSEPNEDIQTASSIFLSTVFLSGKVRMHSSFPRTSILYDFKGHTLPASVVESFNLPMLSVWGEYRATPSRTLTTDQVPDPSSLVLKSTIHSSENTLRPTLLPFITELVNHIERRMRNASPTNSSLSNRGAISAAPPELNTLDDHPPVSSMHITLALRIDQSKLQLTCQPDVNVIAGVYWDSGGFLVNISSSGRQISFIGNVGGLTIGLKHGFLSEDCVRLDARNLAFSTTFTGVDKSSGIDISSMSVVVDTEVSGGLRFSRFQDVLCFKAVWLDRIPILSATPGGEPTDSPLKAKSPPTSVAVSPTKTDFATVVLVHFRRIGLDVDLGQSISSVRMDMLDVTFQSKIEEIRAELSVSVGDLTMSATGNISGHARIPDFSFNTMRRKVLTLDSIDQLGEPRMLDMSLKSGRLEMTLESDYQKILHLWSEPLSVNVWDDWTQMSPQVAVLDRLLRLSFVVSGTELIAVGSVGTIPKLYSYGSRFQANLQAQREGAARESKAFRIAQSPKPDNPLSAFANAMLQTARTRLREKEDNLSYAVHQRMQFSLGSLKLVVFPRTMEDNEMASFSANELRADLDLLVESNDLPAKRKLLLAFSGMSASRVGPLNHRMVPNDVRTDVRKWLDALRKDMPISTIFELPAMDMDMETEEIGGVLEYTFESRFAQRSKLPTRREDIFITLNVALYSWLTVLRKNLAREMSQAQEPLDRRSAAGLPVATPSGVSTPRRRRTITESPTLDIGSLATASPQVSPRQRGLTHSDATVERHRKSTFSMSAMPIRSDALGPPMSFATPSHGSMTLLPLDVPTAAPSSTNVQSPPSPIVPSSSSGQPPSLVYQPRRRHIERLQMRQLGEATPDVMHPFFTKKAGFSLEDALPQYVHEYGTMPIEEITRALLKLYSRQLSHSAPQ